MAPPVLAEPAKTAYAASAPRAIVATAAIIVRPALSPCRPLLAGYAVVQAPRFRTRLLVKICGTNAAMTPLLILANQIIAEEAPRLAVIFRPALFAGPQPEFAIRPRVAAVLLSIALPILK